jgi:hypothetical protein
LLRAIFAQCVFNNQEEEHTPAKHDETKPPPLMRLKSGAENQDQRGKRIARRRRSACEPRFEYEGGDEDYDQKLVPKSRRERDSDVGT